MGFIKDGLDFLLEQQLELNSVEAVYRSGDSTAQVRAICAGVGSGSNVAGGIDLGGNERDFIISAADWAVDPLPGDTITTGGRVFEVATIPGEGCYRWTSGYHKARRIHTKYLGAETETNDADQQGQD